MQPGLRELVLRGLTWNTGHQALQGPHRATLHCQEPQGLDNFITREPTSPRLPLLSMEHSRRCSLCSVTHFIYASCGRTHTHTHTHTLLRLSPTRFSSSGRLPCMKHAVPRLAGRLTEFLPFWEMRVRPDQSFSTRGCHASPGEALKEPSYG